jgi:hypothetical protein
LLSLHYRALLQANEVLAPGGAVLSMLGGHEPLAMTRDLVRLAGHRGETLRYGWKRQADAEWVAAGLARQQRAGRGLFHFNRVEYLEAVFAGVDPASAGEWAFEMEAWLAPARLDPFHAWAALQRGEPLGHTVAVLRSQPDGRR